MDHNYKKLFIAFLSSLIIASTTFAGPPFNTDDPEPVDFLHWEFYVASSYQFERHFDNATLPHIEINYGAIPNMQLHLLTGTGYAKEYSNHQYGFMVAELGIKYRFINLKNGFQFGIFPLIELPTTSKQNLVGNSHLQAFLPVWLQNSWQKFTTYGGAGYWINPGENNKNWIFVGWEFQYNFSETVSLGGEVYYQSDATKDGENDSDFKIGGIINVNDSNHILFSIGHSFKNTDIVSGYIGYQLTF